MSKSLLALGAALCATLPACAAEKTPATLDLSDCRILAGKLYADAYRSTLAAITQRAKGGSFEDQRKLAAIATNRFACFQESISDSAGWTIISDGKEKGGAPGVVTTSTLTVDVPTLKRHPEGLQALLEAERTAQAIADRDLAFRSIAARYVADYKDAFLPADHADAYRNAVGVKAVACRDAGGARGKGAASTFCSGARAAVASLHGLLPADKRGQLEASGLAWAEAHLAGASGLAAKRVE